MKLKLTPQLIDKITAYIHGGNYVNTSCYAVGISENTYYRWVDQGVKDMEQGIESIYVQFCESVKKADANCEVDIISDTKRKVLASSRAIDGVIFASRRWKDRWAERVESDVSDNRVAEMRYQELLAALRQPKPGSLPNNETLALAEAKTPA